MGFLLLGCVPGLGVIPNGINAVISVARGEYKAAAFSVLACIPIAGPLFKLAKIGTTGSKVIGESVALASIVIKHWKAITTGAHLIILGISGDSIIKNFKKVSAVWADIKANGANWRNVGKLGLASGNILLAGIMIKNSGKGLNDNLKLKEGSSSGGGEGGVNDKVITGEETFEGNEGTSNGNESNENNVNEAIVTAENGFKENEGAASINEPNEKDVIAGNELEENEGNSSSNGSKDGTGKNENISSSKNGSDSLKDDTLPEKTCKTDGDPVNVVTGGFYLNQTDLIVEDRCTNIEIKRRYNSTDTSIGPMGRGWTFEHESRIEWKADKKEVTLVYPDGHIGTFTKNEEGWKSESPAEQAHLLVENEDDGSFTLILKDKKCYKYDAKGNLTSICDKNGNTITINYDAKGDIKTMISPGGKILSFKYNHGKIIEIADNIERIVTYKYEDDNLIEVDHPNDGILTYTYKDNLISAAIDQAGSTYVRNEYDKAGRVIKQYDREGYIVDIEYNDKDMESTFSFRATGVIRRYKYNREKLVTEKIYNDGTRESYTYDEYNNKNSETDKNGRITRYIYDNRCNLLETIYPDGYSIKNHYDETDKLIKTESTGGRELLYTYNNKGNLLEKLEKIHEEVYAKTTYTYDKYGRLLTKKDAENNTTEFQYKENSFDKYTTVKDPESNVFNYEYDTAGRMTSINTAYGTVEFGYNALNKKTHICDAKGNITRLMYDKLGNLIKKVLPKEYNPKNDNGLGYTYRYDAMDRLIKTVDSLENVFAVKYDVHGNLIKQINPNYYNRAEDDGLGIEYKYDLSGRKIKTIYPTGGEARIKYDSAGNIIKTIDAVNYNKETDDGPGTEYEYDEMNRLLRIKDPEGNIARKFIYDIEGNVVKEIDAKGYLSADTDERRYGTLYKYNTAGWLLEKRVPVEQASGNILYNVTLYKYDKAGKKIEEKKSPLVCKREKISKRMEYHKLCLR